MTNTKLSKLELKLLEALEKVVVINKDVHGWSSNGWSHTLSREEVFNLLGVDLNDIAIIKEK